MTFNPDNPNEHRQVKIRKPSLAYLDCQHNGYLEEEHYPIDNGIQVIISCVMCGKEIVRRYIGDPYES